MNNIKRESVHKSERVLVLVWMKQFTYPRKTLSTTSRGWTSGKIYVWCTYLADEKGGKCNWAVERVKKANQETIEYYKELDSIKEAEISGQWVSGQ